MGTRRLTIGRSSECDIVLADPSVSRVHAELTVSDDGSLAVADRKSTSGTFLVQNGEPRRIAASKIAPGEAVRFGSMELTAAELLKAAAEPSLSKDMRQEQPLSDRPAPQARRVRCECGTIKQMGTVCPDCGAR
ncbi:MAG: FHA domain-containing protein [Bdellovibrionales bacterium]|nr:FHA domain-containing protein [Bdellovibrionales bacterium]